MNDEFSVLDWCTCGPEVFAQEMMRLTQWAANPDEPFRSRMIFFDDHPDEPKDDTPVVILSMNKIDVLLVMGYNSPTLMRRTENIESLLNPDNVGE